ncbi:MAG: hypothetical protein KBA30_06300 [Clostridia bacterium]|nr:hypothetical protein [Clostridia bacterium]
MKTRKNDGLKKARPVSREGGPICDVDLRSCEIELANGAVVQTKPDKFTALVKNMMICDSPICSGRNVF